MLNRRTDLPLDRDAIGRYLPWLIAFMVYLAVLALAGLLVLAGVAERWNSGLGDTLTVQVMPVPGGRSDAKGDQRRVDKVLKILRATPGIINAHDIAETRVLALLEPWLGTVGASDDLPLPHLIDAEIDPAASIDIKALEKRLAAAVSGTAVDDHGLWLERLINLISMVEVMAAAVLGLIGFATVGTVIFTTRTGLAIHYDVIEVLHLIGAHDSYIAGQFANRALGLGLRGGIFGLLLAAPTLGGISYMAADMDQGVVPDLSLGIGHALVVAALPVLAAVIAMLTAHLTVLRTLARMP